MPDIGGKPSLIQVDTLNPNKIADILQEIQEQKAAEARSVIPRKVPVPMGMVERAIAFWKPILFDVTKEGRQLNGMEAYELGDEKQNSRPNKAPYIAMCNLMALEGVKMMGDCYPTVEDAKLLAFATDREGQVADFWHKSFAPTAFQTEWAWKAVLAMMSGSEVAYREMLVDYKEQLP